MKNPISSLLVVFLVGAFHATDALAATAQEISARLDEFMRQQVERRQFSGTVLVAREGRILLEKGYGFANREWTQPNASDTKFRIGSSRWPASRMRRSCAGRYSSRSG